MRCFYTNYIHKYHYILIGVLASLLLISTIKAQSGQANSSSLYGAVTEDASTQLLLPKGMPPAKMASGNIFVKAVPSKTNVFVGEPFHINYLLFTRLQSKSHILVQPQFSGCTVKELATNNEVKRDTVINGKKFSFFVLRSVQITPIKKGIININNMIVGNSIDFYSSKEAIYNQQADRIFNNSCNSNSLQILVSTIKGMNDSTEAVTGIGEFTIDAKLEKTTDTSNGMNALIITITGKGNFSNISCPSVKFPVGVETFPVEKEEQLDESSFPTKGFVQFTIPFSNTQVGNFTIENISLPYFNIAKKQWDTLTTKPIQYTVNKSTNAYGIDEAKLTKGFENTQYLYLIAIIALGAALGFYLKFVRKKPTVLKKEAAAITETTQIESNESIKPSVDSILTATLALKGVDFFKKSAEIIPDLKMNRVLSEEDATTIKVICEQVLYAKIETDNQRQQIESILQTCLNKLKN